MQSSARMMRPPRLHHAVLAALALSSCAGPVTYSKRVIDTPAGQREHLGVPKSTAYRAEVQMEHNIAHIRVLQLSECPVIRVRLFDRVEETLQGSKVVETVRKGTHEVADTTPGGLAPCEERFGQQVPLTLEYAGNHYPLGSTSPTGELEVDLATVVRARTRQVELSQPTAMLTLQGRPLYEVPIAGLSKHLVVLDGVIAELSAICSKPAAKLTDADVTHASGLYAQMMELGADDARVVGLQRRYLEVIGGLRALNESAMLKRNLSALSEAKDLLKALNPGVPSYVQMAIYRNQPSRDALAWAEATALTALRAQPALCQGALDWARLAALTGSSKLAFSFLRYAYDDDYLGSLSSYCSRARG